MTPPAARRPVRRFGSFQELAEAAQLDDVVFLEVGGRRLFDRPEPRPEEELRTALSVWLRQGDDGATLEVRCRLELAAAQADFVVDAVAAFSLGGPFELGAEAQQWFVDQIGVTVLYPYLRESVHSTAAKLGIDTPLLSVRSTWPSAHPAHAAHTGHSGRE
ncbi:MULTISPECIES: hypothetical protein [unclassified Streptomyces]|uniref:hypothetical protein n=1 Tax=Streptomycetaceae TaxID=2062 RepID=UPI002E762E92|nr:MULTISPECIES: hypothetical protein [unclassified Streptomyces]MED7954333.1 hypothetical protein [Streptomyces sp. BE303]MEE1826769.1 hypothetical protein [Streptomyces sp. BE20]